MLCEDRGVGRVGLHVDLITQVSASCALAPCSGYIYARSIGRAIRLMTRIACMTGAARSSSFEGGRAGGAGHYEGGQQMVVRQAAAVRATNRRSHHHHHLDVVMLRARAAAQE